MLSKGDLYAFKSSINMIYGILEECHRTHQDALDEKQYSAIICELKAMAKITENELNQH